MPYADYQEHLRHMRAYSRRYMRALLSTVEGRAKHAARARRYRRLHKLKAKARSDVTHAIASGILVPLPCEVCGKGKTQAHHEDYTKPLDVRWLCRKHHMALHRKAV